MVFWGWPNMLQVFPSPKGMELMMCCCKIAQGAQRLSCTYAPFYFTLTRCYTSASRTLGWGCIPGPWTLQYIGIISYAITLLCFQNWGASPPLAAPGVWFFYMLTNILFLSSITLHPGKQQDCWMMSKYIGTSKSPSIFSSAKRTPNYLLSPRKFSMSHLHCPASLLP